MITFKGLIISLNISVGLMILVSGGSVPGALACFATAVFFTAAVR
jgi:hypothetical protein